MNREEALKILINGESEPCYKTCDEDCGKVMICYNRKCKWAEAMDVIREALKDRPHGKWEHWGSPFADDTIANSIVCSRCKARYVEIEGEVFNFCPNCGAPMMKDGEAE